MIFELPFSGDWDKLVQLSSRWVWDTNFESLATRIVKQRLKRAAPALVKPYTAEWLKEDYFTGRVTWFSIASGLASESASTLPEESMIVTRASVESAACLVICRSDAGGASATRQQTSGLLP